MTTPESAKFRNEIILSFQRALLGMVTPQLRMIVAEIADSLVHAKFIYESVSEEETELVEQIRQAMAVDLAPSVDLHFAVIAVPEGPCEHGANERWIYLRHEGDYIPDSELVWV